jgi:hypothetical protein
VRSSPPSPRRSLSAVPPGAAPSAVPHRTAGCCDHGPGPTARPPAAACPSARRAAGGPAATSPAGTAPDATVAAAAPADPATRPTFRAHPDREPVVGRFRGGLPVRFARRGAAGASGRRAGHPSARSRPVTGRPGSARAVTARPGTARHCSVPPRHCPALAVSAPALPPPRRPPRPQSAPR